MVRVTDVWCVWLVCGVCGWRVVWCVNVVKQGCEWMAGRFAVWMSLLVGW